MEFRWVALIALWTMLAGPMFDSPLETSHTHVGPDTVRAAPQGGADASRD